EQGENFQKVITWKNFTHKLDYLEVVSDEVELLKRFRQIIHDYQPEIITGYYSDGFDFPYLKTRAEKHGLKLNLGLDRSELIVSARGGNTEAKIKGILHLDTFKFIRNIIGLNLKTDSYSLDAVSKELLDNKKHDVNLDELSHIWDNQPDKLEHFCAYNLQDAHLALQLCQKLLPDMIEFTKLISLPLSDIIRMRFSRLVESYILKRAIEFNVIAPNRPGKTEIEQRSEETYQGGFVYEPKPGLYEDIVVFDFRSLYPTIISAHGIGPEGLHCQCCQDEPEVKVPGQEEYWFCSKKKHFIPSVLERLILRRVDLKRLIKEAKDKGKDTKILSARSYALKTLANSFYGYLGFFGARWYCLECARSTTAYARNYIKSTIKKAEEKGFQVIYGDSLTPERKIFIMTPDEEIELVSIGDFVNGNLESLSLNNYKTLAYDGSKLVFIPIRRVIKHKYNSKEKGCIIKFITTHGITRVTPQHSVYNYGIKNPTLMDASTLKEGDALVSLTNVPLNEKYKLGHLFDLATLSFGKMDKEIAFYKDNLRFPPKRGICPYCKKDVHLSSHIFNIHSNRRIAKRRSIHLDFKWVGTNQAGGGRIPRYWELTTELAWILGYYCADGSVSDITTSSGSRKCLISFGSQDKAKIERVKYYFDNVLEDDLKIIVNYDQRINKRMYYYRVQRIPLVGLFESAFGCGKKSYGKTVPGFVYSSEEKIRRAFLEGYLAGDGNQNKDKRYRTHFVRCDTNSKDLACGLQYLFKSLSHGKSYHNKEIKHIGWSYRPDKPNISSIRVQSVKKPEYEKENFCAARIKEIKTEDYEDFVYDLEVEEHHNFVDAEGLILVHNTDSMFMILGEQHLSEAKEFMNEINFDLPGHM
ncbi:MAG: hypothetical protein KKH52_00695, partial [Nanoarchaeota archaeon]|nr:hypothetical protein [Nanoarchaeota archaeon]